MGISLPKTGNVSQRQWKGVRKCRVFVDWQTISNKHKNNTSRNCLIKCWCRMTQFSLRGHVGQSDG